MANKLVRSKRISYAVQKIGLLSDFPESSVEIIKNKLIWKGCIKPTDISQTYKVRIELANGYYKAFVYGDNLKGLDRPDFPHKFSIDETKKEVRICLSLVHEFQDTMLITKTIIPWISEWLFHYEIWLFTGSWNGGGKHLNTKLTQ